VYHYLRSEAGRHEINQKTKGSVRFRLYYQQLALIPIPVPGIDVQVRFAEVCRRVEDVRQRTLVHATDACAALGAIRREAFFYDRKA
jgi:type I restriction enzyme M protein